MSESAGDGFVDHLIGHAPVGRGDFSIGGNLWPGLSKLVEECGEVLQVGGKLMGSEGRTDHWSGDLKPMLEDEIADVIAAARFFTEVNPALDISRILARADHKIATFHQWHRDIQAQRS